MAGKQQATQQQAVIRHAQDDMASLPPERRQEQEQQPPGIGDRAIAWYNARQAGQPAFWAQIAAMTREAVKDIQNTFHQVMYGHPQQHGEPGTPLNPTMQQVTKSLGNFYGQD